MLPGKFNRRALATAASVAALLALSGASAADQEPARKIAASKFDLTPESMPKLFALVRPQETEWRHLQIQWITDVVAVRKQAAKDDKPIVVLYTEVDPTVHDLPPERRRPRSFVHAYLFKDREEFYWDPDKWLDDWKKRRPK